MYCKKCGAEILEGNQYCSSCGVKVYSDNDTHKTPNKKIIFILILLVIIVSIIAIFVVKFNQNKEDVFWRNAVWGMSVDKINTINKGCEDTPVGFMESDSKEMITKYYANILNLEKVDLFISYSLDSNENVKLIRCFMFNQNNEIADSVVIDKVTIYLNDRYGKCDIEKSRYVDAILSRTWKTKEFTANLQTLSDGIILLKYEQP